jgi:hypothetical protein
MKLTVTKIKKILEKDYGWDIEKIHPQEKLNDLIKDTLKVIQDETKRLKK